MSNLVPPVEQRHCCRQTNLIFNATFSIVASFSFYLYFFYFIMKTENCTVIKQFYLFLFSLSFIAIIACFFKLFFSI